MAHDRPAPPSNRPAASVGRFEGWYGFGYNRMMRRAWLRRSVYGALGGAPALQDLPAFFDRILALHPAGSTLLDVPCGEGLVERMLQERSYGGRAIGLDLAARAVARTSALRVDFALEVVHGSALDMPFDDASMATVVSINGLHVMPDHARFLAELGRVVRSDGSIWLTTLVTGHGVRRRVTIGAVRQLGVLPTAPPDRHELEAMIGHAGLRIADDLGGSTVAALRLVRSDQSAAPGFA